MKPFSKKTAVQMLSVLMVAPIACSALAKHDDYDDDYEKENKYSKSKDTMVISGTLSETATGAERGLSLDGRIMMLKRKGDTEVYVHVTGLPADSTFMTHVHDLPCSLGGGAHYKIDPTVSGTIMDNEIWPTVTTDGTGTGVGFAVSEHNARLEAQSIVIHDSDGARVACGSFDATVMGKVMSGDFEVVDSQFDDEGISGVAQLSRLSDQTVVQVAVSGLAENTTYPAHVHAERCEFNKGGAHYKIDPTVAGTVMSNEIHPMFETDNYGDGSVMISSSHVARTDAQSIVIHQPTGEKFLCANLDADINVDNVMKGSIMTTNTGLQRGFKFEGFAQMERSTRNKTSVTIMGTGFDEDLGDYPVHVHNGRCAVGGGSHYKIDTSNPNTEEDNEMWPDMKLSKKGFAYGKVSVKKHIARPEAQSVVIHDPTDGARIACVDLATSK